mmetsp:Transcript_1527/g.5997  ORF Transcript_1527/g.5997 Transcript_1527/m.5997 type:complete len:549 (+) Transcript_1527:50-1696(+)
MYRFCGEGTRALAQPPADAPLVAEVEQRGDPAQRPVVLVLVAGDAHVHDEVGAVARGGEHAPALHRAVDGHGVVRRRLDVRGPHGHEAHDGHGGEEHLGLRLGEHHRGLVEARALQEEAVDVGAVVGLLRVRVLGHHLEVPRARVDGDGVLARVVLHDAGEEGLREEEVAQVEHGRRAVLQPRVQHRQALHEVGEVGAQRLEARVRLLEPQLGRPVVVHGVVHALHLAAHHAQPLERLLNLPEARADDARQPVEAHELLHQHRVHRLLVQHGKLEARDLEVEVGRQAALEVGRELPHDRLGALPPAAAAAAQRVQDGAEHEVDLLLVLGDARVGVQPEHTGRGDLRQPADEAQHRLVVVLGRRAIDVRVGRQPVVGVSVDALGEEDAHDGHERGPVVVVRDAPAVVALAHEVRQRLQRHLVLLVDEHLQLAHGDLEVGVVEAIGDVPAEGAVLLALLHEGVEEAQPEEQRAEGAHLGALAAQVELVRLDGVGDVRLHDVGAEPCGGLVGHLDAVLQNCHRKVLRRVRREPQPEVGVRVLRGDALADAL